MSADFPMLNIERSEAVRKTWREIYGTRCITRRNESLTVKSKKHKETDLSRQCLMISRYTGSSFYSAARF